MLEHVHCNPHICLPLTWVPFRGVLLVVPSVNHEKSCQHHQLESLYLQTAIKHSMTRNQTHPGSVIWEGTWPQDQMSSYPPLEENHLRPGTPPLLLKVKHHFHHLWAMVSSSQTVKKMNHDESTMNSCTGTATERPWCRSPVMLEWNVKCPHTTLKCHAHVNRL